MPRAILPTLVLALGALGLGALLPASAWSKGGAAKEAAKPAEWTEEDGRTVLHVHSPSPLKAYLGPAPELQGGAQAELVVILHGHGGTATGMLGYGALAVEGRKAYVLACEGSGAVTGAGHSWSEPDVAGILACLDAALERLPVDRKRVIVMGHSAGGTMSLRTCAARPTAFAGVFTTAAPMTPTSAQKGARVVVCLGTKDGNYAGFPAAVQAAEKTVVARVMSVADLAHDLPDAVYAREGLAWLLDSKAPSETLYLPFAPASEAGPPPESAGAKAKGGPYRHALAFQAGGRGAPKDARARLDAKETAGEWAGAWKKRPAGSDFGDLLAKASEDPLSRELRGLVSGAVLARYGAPLALAMSKLRGGDVSAPVEGDAGWHVVTRDP